MPTIILTDEQARALLSTFDSASRGREDFDYLAGMDAGDYSPEDVEEAHAWHAREREVETLIRTQLGEA
jgi:hypothetical protein